MFTPFWKSVGIVFLILPKVSKVGHGGRRGEVRRKGGEGSKDRRRG